ncbi:signal peptidase I [Allorhizocola rhizosphaerae]|uniref:signal peptidase I n=1 Tax=Allorhizocola rhizosphaerae TaxID=1872709 RepID=UPI0013C30C14|nr:signal peptidase I [Allorhizocola rhizosphaerae]
MLLLLAGLLVMTIRYDTYVATTGVMAPSFRIGEVALVDPAERNARRPQRGDVVLVKGTHWPGVPTGHMFVLRVVAVAGDRISCCGTGGALLLNGEPLQEPYAWGANEVFGRFDIVVPDGRIFLLGDERDRSRDSRELLAPGHVHADHVHDHADTSYAAHATVAVDEAQGTILTVISPPWRLRGVSSAPATSPHFYALAATALGLLILLVVMAPPAARLAHQLYRRVRRRRTEVW